MVRSYFSNRVSKIVASRREFLRIGGVLIPVGLSIPGWLEAQSAPNFDYYVSPTGSDSNAGTLAAPWAITSLSPYSGSGNYSKIGGKSVGLLPGTYGVSALMKAAWSVENTDAIALDLPGGTAASPTYIASCNSSGVYSPRTATIKANDNGTYGGSNSIAVSMIGSTSARGGHVTLDGLVLTGCSIWCVTFGDTAGSNTSRPGFKIQNCEITGNNGQSSTNASGRNLAAISVMSATDCVIYNNYIHDNVGWADNEHFAAIYHWGLGTGTSGTQITYNTIINSGCLHGKEAKQWNTTIAYNYVDMTRLTPGGSGAYSAAIIGFLADAGNGTLSTIHHNVLISYSGGAGDSPSALGGTWIDLTFDTGQAYWDSPVSIYSNTCIASGALNGCGVTVFEEAAGSRLVSAWNNLFWDAGFNAVNQYGWWFTNADAFKLCDYNLYGAHQGSQWASFAANGTQDIVSSTVATFAAWQSAIGGLDSHSSILKTNPFTNNGPLALGFQVDAGSPAYQAGRVGGTVQGATCNIGAWDGVTTQIGCNFAGSSSDSNNPPIPTSPQLHIL